MKNAVELLASYWTIAGAAIPHSDHEFSPFEFKHRVEAAAQAGFTGLGLWHADLEHILQRRSLKEMRQILNDNGIKHVELEFLTDWFLDGDRKKQSDERKEKLLIAAEVLGAHHVKVGDFYRENCPMPRLVETFAKLCRDAAEHGTKIAFELMPFAMIRTLAASIAMVESSGAKNGGIVLDLWHIVKLGIVYEELQKLPLRYIVSVELNDGTFQAPWSLHEDTVNHRRLCSDGEFDVKGFIDVLQKIGYQGPWGVEVLSAELRTWPLEQLTTRAFQTTFQQFPSGP